MVEEQHRLQSQRKKVLDLCMAHGATIQEAIAIANGYAEQELVDTILRRVYGQDPEWELSATVKKQKV